MEFTAEVGDFGARLRAFAQIGRPMFLPTRKFDGNSGRAAVFGGTVLALPWADGVVPAVTSRAQTLRVEAGRHGAKEVSAMQILPLRKILWPTDFSDCSYTALSQATQLALAMDAELYLLYVIPPLPKPVFERSPAGIPPSYQCDLDEYEDSLRSSAQQKLHEVIEKQVPPGVKARFVVGQGDAASEIARIAENERVGVIVMATHGMTGWRNVALGSVAERVIRLSTRPVLSIRVPCGGHN